MQRGLHNPHTDAAPLGSAVPAAAAAGVDSSEAQDLPKIPGCGAAAAVPERPARHQLWQDGGGDSSSRDGQQSLPGIAPSALTVQRSLIR